MEKESTSTEPSIKNIANIENLKNRAFAIFYLYCAAQHVIERDEAKNKLYLSGFSFIISFLICFWGNLSGKLWFINFVALIIFGIMVFVNIKKYYKSIESRKFSYSCIENILKHPNDNNESNDESNDESDDDYDDESDDYDDYDDESDDYDDYDDESDDYDDENSREY